MLPLADAPSRKPTDRAEREHIVEVADRLYYEHGFRRVGMDALRQHTGVSLKRLYALFPSKESIVLAVLEYRQRLWAEEVAASAARAGDPRSRLLGVFDYLSDWFGSDTFRGCVFINAFGELGSESAAVAAKATEHKQNFQGYLRRLAQDAGYSEELGDQLLLLAEGAQTTAAITGDTSTARKARRAAETLMRAED